MRVGRKRWSRRGDAVVQYTLGLLSSGKADVNADRLILCGVWPQLARRFSGNAGTP